MRILSKTRAGAILLALTALSCARVLPWSKEPIGEEVNLAFTLERNLIHLTTVRIDNRPGRFILGTAAPRTIVDPTFPLRNESRHALQISEKQTVEISPAPLDLRGVADAIVGAEPWRNRAISIDYRIGLVTWQKEGIHRSQMVVYQYPAEPMVTVQVNGRDVAAIVDTTSPDTLVLPGADGRGTASVQLANIDFGTIDVQYANVTQARIGNRLLSRFLVTVDYGRKVVGLWRDPRTPL
jgi:hypothetical protein